MVDHLSLCALPSSQSDFIVGVVGVRLIRVSPPTLLRSMIKRAKSLRTTFWGSQQIGFPADARPTHHIDVLKGEILYYIVCTKYLYVPRIVHGSKVIT